MGEERGLGRVAGDEPDLAAMDSPEHRAQPFEIHRLFEAVANRLADQRVIGDLAVARDVLEARGGVWKHRGHEIVGQHPLQLRRDLASAPAPRHGEGDGRVPSPSGLEHRRIEERLHQHVARGLGMEVAEHVRQRKRVLRPERQHQRILGRRRLELEIELTAEPLPQSEAPGLVDAAAKRSVQDHLHPARLVEEPLEDECLLRRNHTERPAALHQIRDGLFRGTAVQAGFRGDPRDQIPGRTSWVVKFPVGLHSEVAQGAR